MCIELPNLKKKMCVCNSLLTHTFPSYFVFICQCAAPQYLYSYSIWPTLWHLHQNRHTYLHTPKHNNSPTCVSVRQEVTLASAAHSTHCRSFCRRRERVRKQSQQEFPNRKKRGLGRREGGHDGVEGREVVDTAHCHCYPSPSLKIAASIKPLMILALCHGSVRERDQNV